MLRTHVHSSNLLSVGYENLTLEIEFRGGSVYQYHGVPEHLYRQLMASASKGQFFQDFIRNVFTAIRIR